MVTLMSSTMIAPALSTIADEFSTDQATVQMNLSIFLLAYVFGPMFLAPMTEVFGRKPVWILSGCFYILWNAVGGFATNNATMTVSRFFAGLGASAEYAVRTPTVLDRGREWIHIHAC